MITFIFPIYKQEHVLEKGITLLDQYLSNHLDENYEILICNDGSPDQCPKIAKDLSKKLDAVKEIGYEKNRGKGYAIKYASLHASGNDIIYMDCDLAQEKYFVCINEIIKNLKQYESFSRDEVYNDRKAKFLKIGRDKGFAKSANLTDSNYGHKESFLLKIKRDFSGNKYLYYGSILVILTILITLFSVA